MEDHPRLKTAWICDKQLWNRRTKRIPRKDIPSEIEESLNYDDARQFPRISDTRFISESKLPSMAVIRRHDLTRFAQVDLSSDKSKLDGAKPKVLISIGIQEENAGNDQQEKCSTRKSYCKHNQGWQMQQPFYVDEPRWIDIDVDYIERMNNGDPYILTRGKKIYRIDSEQVDKTVEDYEAILDYLSKNKKLLIKNRVRRSARENGGSQDQTADERNDRMKERDHYDSFQDTDRDTNIAIIKIKNGDEKSFKIDKILKDEKANYVFNKIYEKVEPKNLANRSSRRYKFIKQNQIFGNEDTIADFVEQRQKIQREDNNNENGSSKTARIDQIERLDDSKSHFAINTNRKSVLLKNHHLPEIRKKREIGNVYSKKDVEKNETATYKQMKNKVYVNELNDLGIPDNLFALSRDKDSINSGRESLNKKDLDDNKFIERTWELHYAHRKKLENEEEAKNEEDGSEINNNVGIGNSQLTNAINFNSKNFEAKAKTNYQLGVRERRNVCKACRMKSQFQRDEWLKDIKRKIQDSSSLERRDKHSDSDIWTLSPEPYFISRGKKVPRDFGRDDLPSMPSSRNTNDGERAKVLNFPVADGLLRTLLTEMFKCNDENCGMNANRLSNERLSPRDRRDPRPGMLEEIFAKYDPYYVARGKRMNRNQKGVSLETDAMQ